MIFKLQVGLPKSPNLGQVLNFHTQSVHFLLTLQLRQLAKTTTTLQTFSVHFSEVKLFCCLSLLRLWPMLAMVARPSSNYVLFSSKEKVFEKL